MAAFAVVFQLTSSRGGWPFLCFFYNSACNISTHILTRRMTLLIQFHRHLLLHFNSHPHEEDDNRTGDCYNLGSISTHILTRRMTKTFHIIAYDRYISTHILTRRMTPLTKYVGAPDVFQLTSSRGGWLYQHLVWIHNFYFNSHPHEEDDWRKLHAF